jgi:hypothetical protein
MHIDVIYSYADGSQDHVQLPLHPCLLDSESTLRDWLMQGVWRMEIEEGAELPRQDFTKISCCITTWEHEDFFPPEWYNALQGKFYFPESGQ